MLSLQKLLIVSHVVHYQYQGRIWAYGPYVKEIEIWAEIFPSIIIASPLKYLSPPGDAIPFEHTNISIEPQVERGGDDLNSKIFLVLSLPSMIISLCKAMSHADAIHVRCPGNLGLLGTILAPFFTPYRIAKYAGQWNGFPGETNTTKLQKEILKSRWWNSPVTVYGVWPNQPNHVIPFFTSIMTDDQMAVAQLVARQKRMHDPIHILYVGRLTVSKKVDILIKAIKQFLDSGRRCECRIIGTGPELSSLLELTRELDLERIVEFKGGLPFDEVLGFYEWGDILVLASETEGWPKAIAEGMAYGIVCIGSSRGLIPQMLGDGRGILVEPGNEQRLAKELIEISQSEKFYITISRKAAKWSKNFTLSNLQSSLRELMVNSWGLNEDDL